jgi:hypothetical protein
MSNIETKLIERVKSELNAVDIESLFDEMLDDTYGDCEIAGMYFQTSRALKELDPTAYRCGCSDYIDSLIGESLSDEIAGEYYQKEEVDEIREELEAKEQEENDKETNA